VTHSGQKADVRQRPGLSSTGNRALLAIAVAVVTYIPTRSYALALIIGVIVYLLATVAGRNRR
jgi:branched-subunit amino acid transport protein